jgi:hypothetical protein
MMDPTANMHLEKDGIPLSGFEIRQEWFYHEGTHLVFVVGKEGKPYRKADLPIFLARFAGSLPAILAYQPLGCSRLSEVPRTIQIADPVRG